MQKSEFNRYAMYHNVNLPPPLGPDSEEEDDDDDARRTPKVKDTASIQSKLFSLFLKVHCDEIVF